MDHQSKYGFRVAWSEEDENWVATCPDFPMLSAFGDTVEEALNEATEVLALYIDEYRNDNVALPEPTLVRQYSGQTRLRMSKRLHKRVVELAAEESVSFNHMLVELIQDGFDTRCRREHSRIMSRLFAKLES